MLADRAVQVMDLLLTKLAALRGGLSKQGSLDSPRCLGVLKKHETPGQAPQAWFLCCRQVSGTSQVSSPIWSESWLVCFSVKSAEPGVHRYSRPHRSFHRRREASPPLQLLGAGSGLLHTREVVGAWGCKSDIFPPVIANFISFFPLM